MACFYETKSTSKTWKKIKKDLGQIVTGESASLPGYKPIAVQASHSMMCKFVDDQDQGYRDVTGAIKMMIANLEKKREDLKVKKNPIPPKQKVKELTKVWAECSSDCDHFW